MADFVVDGKGIAAASLAYYLAKNNHGVSLGVDKPEIIPDSHHAQCVLHKGSFYAGLPSAPQFHAASEKWEDLIEAGVIDEQHCNRGVAWSFPNEFFRNPLVKRLRALLGTVQPHYTVPIDQPKDVQDKVLQFPLRQAGAWKNHAEFVGRLPDFFRNYTKHLYVVTDDVAVCPKTVLAALAEKRPDTTKPDTTKSDAFQDIESASWRIKAFGRSHDSVPSLSIPSDELRHHWILVLSGKLEPISFVLKPGIPARSNKNSKTQINVIARRSSADNPETIWLVDCETLDVTTPGDPVDESAVDTILAAFRAEITDFDAKFTNVRQMYFGSYVKPEKIRYDAKSCLLRRQAEREMYVRLDRFTLAPLMGDVVVGGIQ